MPYKDKEKQAEAQKRYEEKRKKENRDRHAVWMLIFYPDSAPPEWPDLLSELHLPIWVSPLHDRDVWTEADEKKNPEHKAGELKKPHYHLVARYEGKADRQHFLEDFKCLNGPSNVKVVQNLVSMVRYLIHKDDPEKAQYSRDDVKVFGGADLGLIDAVGEAEYDEMVAAMMDFIDDNEIRSFAQFVRYCRACEKTWFRLITRNCTYVIKEYIKSNRYDYLDSQR